MNENVKKVKLGDVCFNESSNIAQKDLDGREGEYPIYGASGIIKNIDFYKCDLDYIAIVKDGGGVGRVMKLPAKSSVISTMQYIVPKGCINIDYLYYLLCYLDLSKFRSGSTIPHIYFKDYKNENVSIFSLEEQREIAYKLKCVDNLIEKRQRQLENLDKLIKSQFIEMFGGYSLRNKQPGWVKVGAVAEVVGGSTPKTDISEYWDGDFYWVTPAEIKEDDFIVTHTQRCLTEKGVGSCSLRRLPVGTVLLSSRAPIGKVAIAGVEMYCNQGFKNLICGEELNSVYVYALLKYNSDYLNSLGRGATFKEISKSIVENIYIPVPAIARQNEFARFVKQTDKSKFTIKQSLEQLEILKKSLMQKYFG